MKNTKFKILPQKQVATFENRPMPDPERSFSWSAISSFEWNKEQWWMKYVLHQKCTYADEVKGTVSWCAVEGFADPECPVVKKTIELAFGSYVDMKIQKDKKFLPKLPRYKFMQVKLKTVFEGITLINIPDGLEYEPKVRVCDYKTGRKPWDQKRADETGQLTFACLVLYWDKKIEPENVDLTIYWLPTHTKDGQVEFVKEGDIRTFHTKRTRKQVLEFGNRILKTYAEMQEYAMNRPCLDTHSYDEF